MPLRFLIPVGVIHLFPILEREYLKLDYFRNFPSEDPQLLHYVIFTLLCVIAYIFRDASAVIGCSQVMVNDERKDGSASSGHYKLKSVPRDKVLQHWRRQVIYDMTVYCIPSIALAVSFPQYSIIRNIFDFIFILCTFYWPIYNRLVVIYFVHVRIIIIISSSFFLCTVYILYLLGIYDVI